MQFQASLRRAAGAVISAIALAACGASDGTDASAQTTTAPGLEPHDIVMGDVNAPVTLVEYASITCPHCATFHTDVLPAIKEDYVDTGKVRYVFRDFPTPPQNIAIAGFAIARCAGEEKYYDVIDDLMRNQNGILSATRAGAAKDALLTVAGRHGIETEATFDACIENTEVRKAIADVVIAGQDRGVSSTPTLFVDGRRIERTETWYTPEGLSAILDDALGVEPAPAPEAPPEAEETDDPTEAPADAPADTPAE